MYKLNVEIESENKIKIGEYVVKDKDLDKILNFCERVNYKITSIRKV